MDGKHVVVTEASSGIGRAIALRLGREGARLTLLARDRDRLGETAARLEGPKVVACDIAADGVQVNAICPGWVDTQMAWSGIDISAAQNGRTREEEYRVAVAAVPLGRMSQPEDIAGTVAWFLSHDARGVTGQGIDQNGGAWM